MPLVVVIRREGLGRCLVAY